MHELEIKLVAGEEKSGLQGVFANEDIGNKRRYISQFGKLICLSQRNPSNGTDFGILCFILPILSLYVWDHISGKILHLSGSYSKSG